MFKEANNELVLRLCLFFFLYAQVSCQKISKIHGKIANFDCCKTGKYDCPFNFFLKTKFLKLTQIIKWGII